MKKLLGISLVAVLAVSPLMAKAETTNPSPIAAAESELASNGTNVVTATKGAYYAGKQITDTDRGATASAAYVKGAYNAAISAVNKVAEDAQGYTNSEIAKLDASVAQTAGADGLALSVTEVDGKITAVTGSIAANTYDAYGAADTAATAAVNALDASVSQTAGADGLALSITQTDGVITAISGSIDTSKYETAGAASTAETNAKAYTDSEIAKLDASVSQTAGADGLALSITEVDGKITAISGSIDTSKYETAGAAAAAETAAKNYTDSLQYTTTLTNTSVSGNVPMMIEWGATSVGSVGLANGSLTTTVTTTAAAPVSGD